MRKLAAVALGLCLCGATVMAEVTRAEANRLSDASAVLRQLRAMPDGIPDRTWNGAQCVAVIPGLKKAAFLIGGEVGKGVVSCRTGAAWSAPVFLELAKGSVGFQIGAEEVDLVLLMMNRRGVDKLLGDKVSLGADASVAAGPLGRAADASTDARLTAEILAYSRAKGAFAGVDLAGGVLRPDKGANADAYGAAADIHDVLLKTTVKAPAAADNLMRALRAESRAPTGRKD